ncbi:DUF4347 domain-containing protein [Geitlerinema sp. PCC 9228]|uniref:DUF4347 domain-containing protein n=1 Tax=Geitlerinema sp. PCC 9228 TaxID=111611 RepID=UPI0008F98EE1|nr:DUF4347 domain-containing protein [Geitlerinema sp. PCC 9228]
MVQVAFQATLVSELDSVANAVESAKTHNCTSQHLRQDGSCTSLALIDPSVENYQSLIAGMVPGTKAILLDRDRNGIQQIGEILENYRNLESIHIIAHGSPGCLYVGNSVLNRQTLPTYERNLQSWRDALAADADIFLYGCRIADTVRNESFLEQLAVLTNANIAATSSITGNAKQGGNWNFEVQIGNVRSSLAISETTQQSYPGILDTITLNVNITTDESDGEANTGNGLSLRDAILTANNDPDNDYIIELQGGETYNLSLSDTNDAESSPDATVADLDIANSGNVTIRTSSGQATIDASNIGGGSERRDRVFQVLDNANLTLENVVVTGGEAPSDGNSSTLPNSEEGGGIRVNLQGELTLKNSTISGNSAVRGAGIFSDSNSNTTFNNSEVSDNRSGLGGGPGGGIFNDIYSTATFNNSTIANNTSNGSGGGIFNNENASASFTNSTIKDNATSFGGDGAGIFNGQNATATVSNSQISGNSATRDGGGIFNDASATLSVSDSTVTGNSSSDDGGGIANFTFNSTANIQNSTISNNYADNGGGGFFNNGSARIYGSTISGNSAGDNGNGGGIDNSGLARIYNSTIFGNSVEERGGGIHNAGFSGETILTLTNSTISGNTSSSDGGGIFNLKTATLNNSTIFENSATGNGAGIFNKDTVTINNSIIAQNQGFRDLQNDGGNIGTGGSNIVEDTNVTDATFISENPQLGSLNDNGGPTPTHLPLDGSPAIDGGANSAVPADSEDLDGDGDTSESIPYDQRGSEFDRISNGTVDIGAVEVQQGDTTPPTISAVTTTNSGTLTTDDTLTLVVRCQRRFAYQWQCFLGIGYRWHHPHCQSRYY